MNFRQLFFTCSVALASLSASAQMPVPVLSGNVAGGLQAAAQADVGKQLETLLLCKAGTNFTLQAVASQFQALGLVKDKDGDYMPRPNAKKILLFGDQVVAARVFEGGSVKGKNEKAVTIYLKHKKTKQFANSLGVSKLDSVPETDLAAFFYKVNGKKNKIMIHFPGVLDEEDTLEEGKGAIKYESGITCVVTD